MERIIESNNLENNKSRQLIYFIFSALPIFWIFWMVYEFGVNVPTGDDWDLISAYNSHDGLTIKYLFSQHNEHRIFFPRMVMFTVLILTNWNEKACMFVSVSLFVLAYVLLIKWTYDKLKGISYYIAGVINFIIGMIFFTPAQYENLFWGFQVGFTMVAMFPIFSFYCYYKYRISYNKKWMFAALISAIIATFSSFQGLAVWLVYFLLFLLEYFTMSKPKWPTAVITVFVGFVCCYLYLSDFNFVNNHSTYVAKDLYSTIRFLFLNIGGSIIALPEDRIRIIFGLITVVISLLIFVYVILQRKILQYIFPLMMILYGYGVIFMAAIGRSGQMQYVVPRYITFSLIAILGVFLIAINEIQINSEKLKCDLKKYLFIGLILFSSFILIQNINTLPIQLSASLSSVQIMLKNHEVFAAESLSLLKPGWVDRQVIDTSIGILEANEFNVFSIEKKDSKVMTARYSIDTITTDGSTVNIYGRIWDDKYCVEKRAVAIEKDNINILAESIAGSMNPFSQIMNGDQDKLSFTARIPYESFQVGQNNINLNVFTLSEGLIYSMPVNLWISEDGSKIVAGSFTKPDKFKQDIKKEDGEALYNIDYINLQINENSKIEASTDSILVMSGWCVDDIHKYAAGNVYLKIGEHLIKAAKQRRIDVADYFNIKEYEDAGFSIILPLGLFEESEYTCSIIIVNDTEQYYFESVLPWTLVVKD